MERQVYRLSGPTARGFAAKAVVSAPDDWVVRIGPPPRTLAQNRDTKEMVWDVVTDDGERLHLSQRYVEALEVIEEAVTA